MGDLCSYLLAGHHDAHVDDPEVVAPQHHAHDVLADIVDVSLHRGQHHCAGEPGEWCVANLVSVGLVLVVVVVVVVVLVVILVVIIVVLLMVLLVVILLVVLITATDSR